MCGFAGCVGTSSGGIKTTGKEGNDEMRTDVGDVSLPVLR